MTSYKFSRKSTSNSIYFVFSILSRWVLFMNTENNPLKIRIHKKNEKGTKPFGKKIESPFYQKKISFQIFHWFFLFFSFIFFFFISLNYHAKKDDKNNNKKFNEKKSSNCELVYNSVIIIKEFFFFFCIIFDDFREQK